MNEVVSRSAELARRLYTLSTPHVVARRWRIADRVYNGGNLATCFLVLCLKAGQRTGLAGLTSRNSSGKGINPAVRFLQTLMGDSVRAGDRRLDYELTIGIIRGTKPMFTLVLLHASVADEAGSLWNTVMAD